jgi:hypothetical protein
MAAVPTATTALTSWRRAAMSIAMSAPVENPSAPTRPGWTSSRVTR